MTASQIQITVPSPQVSLSPFLQVPHSPSHHYTTSTIPHPIEL
jgi:hypothetical protein